jgi:acyl-CoA thioesterase
METEFERGTAVAPRAEGGFTAVLDPAWFIVRGPNGGYLAAILLRALMSTVDDPARAPRSLTIHYLRAPEAGPIAIETTVERAGRSVWTVSARMVQAERPIALALSAFSVDWDAPAWGDARPPAVDPAGPRDQMGVPRPDRAPPFAFNFLYEQRFGSRDPSPSEGAEVGGWFALKEPRVVDAPAAAMFCDAWIPPIFTALNRPAFAPTIDLTIHFRARLPVEGAAADDLTLGRFITRRLHEGFMEEDGELWSEDGVLLAQSRQLALVFGAGG